jgi:hypothetical protein
MIIRTKTLKVTTTLRVFVRINVVASNLTASQLCYNLNRLPNLLFDISIITI